jgi:hypothetical protein
MRIWAQARVQGWLWIRKDTRAMYIDCEKSIASACAIAASLVSLVVSSRGSNEPQLILTVKYAVVSLIIGLVASIATIFLISRGYDCAVSRWLENPASKAVAEKEQGQLSGAELGFILFFAVIGMIGFLEGFLFVARIAFVI